jgi:arginine repressor
MASPPRRGVTRIAPLGDTVKHSRVLMGSAAGAAVDQMELSGVIGTLAGDDTLLIIASDNENASEITAILKDLI